MSEPSPGNARFLTVLTLVGAEPMEKGGPPPVGEWVRILSRDGRVISTERVKEHGAITWRTTGGYTLPRTQPWRLVRDEERDG